jgi:hypothetical protein
MKKRPNGQIGSSSSTDFLHVRQDRFEMILYILKTYAKIFLTNVRMRVIRRDAETIQIKVKKNRMKKIFIIKF